MFDVWHGEIELTTLVWIVSLVILLPVQLLLCFKVKSCAIRRLPAVMLAVLTGAFIILAISVPGWDGLGYVFLAIFAGFMLFTCEIGWGIWVIANRRRKRNNQKSG